MAVKPDRWIRRMAVEHGLIEPFVDHQEGGEVISYGLSSYGYDFRVANQFRRPIQTDHDTLDPKSQQQELFQTFETTTLTLKPGEFVLGRSVEYFRIPRDIITICFGKSTYARIGVICNITPFEPEWEGFVTMMIANTSRLPAKIYANEGIAQVLFLESTEVCDVSYADRKGKYQKQGDITHARL